MYKSKIPNMLLQNLMTGKYQMRKFLKFVKTKNLVYIYYFKIWFLMKIKDNSPSN